MKVRRWSSLIFFLCVVERVYAESETLRTPALKHPQTGDVSTLLTAASSPPTAPPNWGFSDDLVRAFQDAGKTPLLEALHEFVAADLERQNPDLRTPKGFSALLAKRIHTLVSSAFSKQRPFFRLGIHSSPLIRKKLIQFVFNRGIELILPVLALTFGPPISTNAEFAAVVVGSYVFALVWRNLLLDEKSKWAAAFPMGYLIKKWESEVDPNLQSALRAMLTDFINLVLKPLALGVEKFQTALAPQSPPLGYIDRYTALQDLSLVFAHAESRIKEIAQRHERQARKSLGAPFSYTRLSAILEFRALANLQIQQTLLEIRSAYIQVLLNQYKAASGSDFPAEHPPPVPTSTGMSYALTCLQSLSALTSLNPTQGNHATHSQTP